MDDHKLTSALLNIAHALDHLFLLIFATAIGVIAIEFGFERWEDLMPYGAGAFLMFGLGSIPAGRLGDLWGRRIMMTIFFFGIGISSIVAGLTQSAWQLGLVLVVLGLFSSIYHPVGIPMLVQGARRPGAVLGFNGLAGNLGIAAAALLTGLLVTWSGWRSAFIVPGVVSVILGFVFMLTAPKEIEAPNRRKPSQTAIPEGLWRRIFLVVTATAVTGSLLFNFTTNGNAELLRERFDGIVSDPAMLGLLLAAVYTAAAFSQLIVGRMIDRYPLKPLFLGIALFQAPLFVLAAYAEGWWFAALAIGYMMSIFGVIPFTDAIIVRYVDDRMRSRVTGMRLAVSFGVSSAAVWALGPFVKASGFSTLLLTMAGIAVVTCLLVMLLPGTDRVSDVTPQA
ncbi:MAG: MFS transporter [Burkholderiaceae bacterium]